MGTLRTICFVLAELAVLITYTSNLYLPFLPVLHDESSNSTVQHDGKRDILAQEMHTVSFKVVFFLGLAIGSWAAGIAATITQNPVVVVRFLSSVLVLASLVLTTAKEEDVTWHHLFWFVIAFCSLGIFAVEYVYIMECVPCHWRLSVGLLGMGLMWTCSRLYALLMNSYIETFALKLFWNSLAVLVGSGLVEVIRVPRLAETVDGHDERIWRKLFYENRFGRRYLAILLLLWFLHGYVYFGLAHEWVSGEEVEDGEATLSLAFVRLSDGVAKIMTFMLCVWTKQHKAVFVVIVVLNGLSCFVAVGLAAKDEEDSLIPYVGHVSSFLISASFNMMWLGTTETFPNKIRYAAVGLCCCSARLGSLLSVVLVRLGLFFRFPAGIAGVAFLLAAGLSLWLPETLNVRLPAKFKT